MIPNLILIGPMRQSWAHANRVPNVKRTSMLRPRRKSKRQNWPKLRVQRLARLGESRRPPELLSLGQNKTLPDTSTNSLDMNTRTKFSQIGRQAKKFSLEIFTVFSFIFCFRWLTFAFWKYVWRNKSGWEWALLTVWIDEKLLWFQFYSLNWFLNLFWKL